MSKHVAVIYMYVHTVVGRNIWEASLPSLVLEIHLAQICDKECRLGVGLVNHGETRCPHYPIPKVNIGMTIAQRREVWEDDIVIKQATIVRRHVNSGSGGRGLGKKFVYGLSRPRMVRSGARVRNGQDVDRAVRRHDFESGHWYVGRDTRYWITNIVYRT